jgi:hypothetical protein
MESISVHRKPVAEVRSPAWRELPRFFAGRRVVTSASLVARRERHFSAVQHLLRQINAN